MACHVEYGTTLTCRVRDNPILLAILRPQHFPRPPIDEMQPAARKAGDGLVAVLAGLHVLR